MFDPCFGCMPLQQATKICAIVKIVIEVLAIIGVGIALLFLLLGVFLATSICSSASCGASATAATAFLWVVLIAYILIFLLYIVMVVLDVLLILAAGHRNLSRCKLWLVVNMICSVLEFLFGCVTFGYSEGWFLGLGNCIVFGYLIYMMFVVYAFCEQMKRENAMMTPAFAAVEAAPVYGQPSQSTRVGQPPPSYHSSKASMRSHRSKA